MPTVVDFIELILLGTTMTHDHRIQMTTHAKSSGGVDATDAVGSGKYYALVETSRNRLGPAQLDNERIEPIHPTRSTTTVQNQWYYQFYPRANMVAFCGSRDFVRAVLHVKPRETIPNDRSGAGRCRCH